MACVQSTMLTPNPDAMKFTLDISLPDRILANRGDDTEDAFTRTLLDVDGVASVFGVNDFVTVTRVPGAEWGPIVCAVEDAAGAHLPSCPAEPAGEPVERARSLLRDAVRTPRATAVEIQKRPL